MLALDGDAFCGGRGHVQKVLFLDMPRAQIEEAGLRFYREHLTTHRILKRLFYLRSRWLIVYLRRGGVIVSEESLQQVLGHSLVCEVLSHRMAEKVRVHVLGDPRIGRYFLYKLLDAP